MDRTCVEVAVNGLTRRPNRQIVSSIAVKVSGGQRSPEQIVCSGNVQDPGRILMPELISCRAQSTDRVTVEDIDRAGIRQSGNLFVRHTDGEIIDSIAVEVGENLSSQ